ncbi:MAG: hypothetical protein C4547_08760 [Phycisphaerales bacterium]|nr:MAG: hypothetical protein C4547_08760 [Phycisphaerales bacterium]
MVSRTKWSVVVLSCALIGAARGQQYIEGVNDNLPVKQGWTATGGNEQAFLWTPKNTFLMTEIQWHTTAVSSATSRVREVIGGRPGPILREVPYSSNNTGWNGAPFNTPISIIAGHEYYVTMHGSPDYREFVADGGIRLTYYWTVNGQENWNGPFNGEPGQRMIKFFGFPGADCDSINKFKVKCNNGKLKAAVKSSLPEGTQLTIDNDGDQQAVSINRRGKGKAIWKNQSGRHDVTIVECDEFSESVDCR